MCAEGYGEPLSQQEKGHQLPWQSFLHILSVRECGCNMEIYGSASLPEYFWVFWSTSLTVPKISQNIHTIGKVMVEILIF